MSVQLAKHRAARFQNDPNSRLSSRQARTRTWIYRNLWVIVTPTVLGLFVAALVVLGVAIAPTSASNLVTIASGFGSVIIVIVAVIGEVNARSLERSWSSGHQRYRRRGTAATDRSLSAAAAGLSTEGLNRKFIGYDARRVRAYERRLGAFLSHVRTVPSGEEILVPNELCPEAIESRMFPLSFFGQDRGAVAARLRVYRIELARELDDEQSTAEVASNPMAVEDPASDAGEFALNPENFREQQTALDRVAQKRTRWVVVAVLAVSLLIRVGGMIMQNVEEDRARERAYTSLSTTSALLDAMSGDWSSAAVADYAGEQFGLNPVTAIASREGQVVAVAPGDEQSALVYERAGAAAWRIAAILELPVTTSSYPEVTATNDGFVIFDDATVWLSEGTDVDRWSAETDLGSVGTIDHIHSGDDGGLVAFVAVNDGSTEVWSRPAGVTSTWSRLEHALEGMLLISSSIARSDEVLAFGAIAGSEATRAAGWEQTDDGWTEIEAGIKTTAPLSAIVDVAADAAGNVLAVGKIQGPGRIGPLAITSAGETWAESDLVATAGADLHAFVAADSTADGFVVLGSNAADERSLWSNANGTWNRQPIPGRSDLLVALTAVDDTCIAGGLAADGSTGIIWEGPCHGT